MLCPYQSTIPMVYLLHCSPFPYLILGIDSVGLRNCGLEVCVAPSNQCRCQELVFQDILFSANKRGIQGSIWWKLPKAKTWNHRIHGICFPTTHGLFRDVFWRRTLAAKSAFALHADSLSPFVRHETLQSPVLQSLMEKVPLSFILKQNEDHRWRLIQTH